MSKIDYQALREAAVKAGKDKWQAKKINGDFFVIRHGSYTKQHGYTSYQPIAEIDCKPVRDFVAKANPATVLALLDELEAQSKRIAELEANRAAMASENATDDERIMAIEGIHNCEQCGDEEVVVDEMGITRCACGQAANSPATPDAWISCSERMPEETGDIIVVSDGIVMSGISYSRRDGFYIAALEYDDDEPIDGVTHWMPLPEPPQEVNRG
ncbi:ead/Ea22-like family protein [Escherichia coli]|uniref:ead/Ea22-like family protein n=2 Tax=Escherichia coli TaxID=562 RepID=UPI0021BEA5D1|nr:ead/Ea22-like family protein [Escherichia coli]